jgi:L-lactate dehydrogenase complex protein LldF
VVLLDNPPHALLADPEQRDALHCIRCGRCLNVCPIFKNIGGHAYGTTYQGPIGSVITPHFRGLQDWKHLSGASSLCGACTETCPVKIDIHHHLLHNRPQRRRGQAGLVGADYVGRLLVADAATGTLPLGAEDRAACAESCIRS